MQWDANQNFLNEEDMSDYWFLFELLVAPQAMRTELGNDVPVQRRSRWSISGTCPGSAWISRPCR
jgi:hypothetical protein